MIRGLVLVAIATSFITPSVDAKSNQSINIIFDDALETVYTKAAPILSPDVATVAVISGWMGVAKTTMSWSQVGELVDDGWGVLSHSVDHLYFDTLDADERDYQLMMSKAFISENLSLEVNGFVFPGGVYNDSMIEEAYTYYDYVAIDRYPLYGDDWEAWAEQVSMVLETSTNVTVYTHGIGDMWYDADEEAFGKFVEWLRSEDISFGLPVEYDIKPSYDSIIVMATISSIFVASYIMKVKK